jgi:hypothetical protein
MTGRSRKLFALAIAGMAIITGIVLKPTLDQDPRTNLGYRSWKAGLTSYRADYARLLTRDPEFIRRLKGESFTETLQKLRIPTFEGAAFPPNSYRGQYEAALKQREPKVTCHWLDNQADCFGACFWVEEGTIKDFVLVKG